VAIAVVGAATAIFAATMGITATDIKKVLAYSTVSQLGYMFAAAGVGAYTAAIFHLMTHAFFKALLFLGAGSVIHGQHGEQDITKMGGLRSKLPVTFATFMTATLAIAGIFPLAGFFSKDEILWGAWSSGNKIVWGVLALSAGLTAFYMFRLTFLVFFGNYHGDPRTFHHAHESPGDDGALVILAVLSVVGGGSAFRPSSSRPSSAATSTCSIIGFSPRSRPGTRTLPPAKPPARASNSRSWAPPWRSPWPASASPSRSTEPVRERPPRSRPRSVPSTRCGGTSTGWTSSTRRSS
jgi:NADH-quinone oxidoreductase subunit L